jgi:hypothetical protein
MTLSTTSSGRFAVALDADTYVFTLTDRESGTSWETDGRCVRLRTIKDRQDRGDDWYWGFPDPSETIPVPLDDAKIQVQDRAISVSMNNVLVDGERVGLNLTISIEDDRVRFESEVVKVPVGVRILLDIPYRLGAFAPGDDAALVLPRGAGVMVDSSLDREGHTWENLIYSGGQNGWSMPIWGVSRGSHTLCAYARTPYDCYLIAELNDGPSSAYSAWPAMLFDGDRLEYPRRVDYSVADGDYGALARWYRSELQSEGRYRTLEEKADGYPLVHKLPGAVLAEMAINYGGPEAKGRDAKELVAKASEMGFPGLVTYAINIWEAPMNFVDPIKVPQGSREALAEVARQARSVNAAYWLTVYENFVDHFDGIIGYDERNMVRRRDGSVRTNWWSEPRKSFTHTVCSEKRVEHAKERLDGVCAMTGKGSVYVDVEGAIELIECYAEDHLVTREQDAQNRRELLVHAKDVFGTVATESMPIDCLADVVDVGAYFSVFQWCGYGASDNPKVTPPVIPIPLFIMVYHGSVLNMTAKDTDFYNCPAPYIPLWGMMPDEVDEFSLRVSQELRETSYAALSEHRFLTPPTVAMEGEVGSELYQSRDVQISRYADGMSVLANFSRDPYSYEGHTVEPGGWVAWKE